MSKRLKIADSDGNLAGEEVVGEIESAEEMKSSNGRRNVIGETVPREHKAIKVGEEEELRREVAKERGIRKGEAGDAPMMAGDARPGTRFSISVSPAGESVVGVFRDGGLQGQQHQAIVDDGDKPNKQADVSE